MTRPSHISCERAVQQNQKERTAATTAHDKREGKRCKGGERQG